MVTGDVRGVIGRYGTRHSPRDDRPAGTQGLAVTRRRAIRRAPRARGPSPGRGRLGRPPGVGGRVATPCASGRAIRAQEGDLGSLGGELGRLLGAGVWADGGRDRRDGQGVVVVGGQVEVGGRAAAAVDPAAAPCRDGRRDEGDGAARGDRFEEGDFRVGVECLQGPGRGVDGSDPQGAVGPVPCAAQQRADRVEEFGLGSGARAEGGTAEPLYGALRIAGSQRRPQEAHRLGRGDPQLHLVGPGHLTFVRLPPVSRRPRAGRRRSRPGRCR